MVRDSVPWRWIAAFVGAKLAVTIAAAGNYGWHRDELYYLASSHHLAFGFVDYPPLVPVLAAGAQAIAPDSLVALRPLTAIAGGCVIVLAALICRELGGTSRAQVLTALSVLLSPLFIGANVLFQTVTFDQLCWAVALLILARLLRDGGRPLWLLFGLAIGVGLETKFTIAALPVIVLLSLLLSSRRRLLWSAWPWAGAAVALLVFAPNLAWQASHDWMSVQYTLSHHGHTDGPVAYWAQQLLLFGPLFLVPGIAGVPALRRDARFAPLVYVIAGIEMFFFIVGGKSYYPAPIYPLVYAAGAIWLDGRLRSPRAARVAVAAATALSVVLLPIGLPVLPARTMVSLGIWKVRKDFADMVGWPELASRTAAAYNSIPSDQRAGAAILAQNYGEAGAIDLYGPRLGLPSAISPHLTFWYWASPQRLDAQTVVLVGFDQAFANRYFAECRVAGTISNDLGIQNEEYGGLVIVCSGPRQPLSQVWRSLQTLD